MATKTLTIKESAYEALKREKGPHDSFSDTIMKVLSRRSSIRDSFGKWSMTDEEEAKIFKELDSAWESSEDDLRRL